ncbi:MAG: ATP-dependent helicase, RecQ-like [Anaerocolumna sp.]|jgi:ATP-dependent DNA helicase RecQ|nr:ATP-dependent helicase, RecQ-like [Anaerocolumna sp.]
MNKYDILKKYFGYDSLRDGQEILIDSLLNGQDVLGIMPTGAGKSICYQIPALTFEGVTVVISPLISLMIDQVKALNQAGIHAAYINGALTETQITKALEFAKQGKYKIIYVAPERLESAKFMEFAMETEISFLAVDEAHCISQWGQDFRPSYVKIVDFLRKLPKRPVVGAFTATATERVREDILCILQLNHPKLVVTGFDRKNLFFKVIQEKGTKKKDVDVLSYVMSHEGEAGIIYCATRKNVEAVWKMLRQQGILAGKYHAGMDTEERKQNQDDFIYDKNTVMIATNAFGMGIDKSNVRYVLHYNMPQSLENYYQEAGRAGRDGENSECILFYSAQDLMINRFLIESKTGNSEMQPEDLQVVRENDELRLNKMQWYCLTRDCLRQYILSYFGDNTKCDCGNCGNCLAEYEERNVTDICKDIFSCIKESKQRFGMNVIVDVLLGRNMAKIRSFGLNELQCFGLCKRSSESELKTVLTELEQQGYISATKDKYQILKLSNSYTSIMEDQQQMIMRFPKIDTPEVQNQVNNMTRKSRRSDVLNSKGLELFDYLKELRLTLAREQAVPPYIICSDKTLVDICCKIPRSKQEMLKINGIGEYKFEKYGEAFLTAIHNFIGEKIESYTYEGYENSDGDGSFATEPSGISRKKQTSKETFYITEEILSNIVYKDSTTISDFVKMVNGLRDERTMKALTTKTITDKLKEEGYYTDEYVDGVLKKNVSPQGLELGIFLEIRTAESGLQYTILMYNTKAQEFIVESLRDRWIENV